MVLTARSVQARRNATASATPTTDRYVFLFNMVLLSLSAV
jgi:hypothetical protein